MIDPQSQLRQHLEQLDAELQRTPAADETQRQHLDALQREVRALLDGAGPITPEAHPSVGQQLTAGLRAFESTHPALTSLIEQVLSTLSGLGI